MRKTLFILTSILFLSLISCGQADPNKQIDEGKVEGDLYTSEEIGWTMEIPKGWEIVEMEETQATNEKGLKALEETVEGEIDYSQLRNLISFKKNQFNVFQSTSEPFVLEYEGEWEENNAMLKKIIYASYLENGLTTDSSFTTTETIDGITFHTFTFTLYGPKGEIILKQKMFSSLINGFDFGVNLNYNSDQTRDELLAVFRNSKFKK